VRHPPPEFAIATMSLIEGGGAFKDTYIAERADKLRFPAGHFDSSADSGVDVVIDSPHEPVHDQDATKA